MPGTSWKTTSRSRPASTSRPSGRPRRPRSTRAQRRSAQWARSPGVGSFIAGGSEPDLQAVVGSQHLHAVARSRAGDLLQPLRLREEAGETLVVEDGLVVVEAEAAGPRELAQLHPYDVARVPPILLDRDGVGEGVLSVEDHEIGLAEELHEGLHLAGIVLLVLGVGGVDEHAAPAREAVAVGVAAVALELGPHGEAGDLVLAPRLQAHELDAGAHAREVHGERGGGVLTAQRLLHRVVAAVDAHVVTGKVGGHEEGKAQDVIPVQVRHENMKAMAGGPAGGQHAVAEAARPAAEVAQHVVRFARLDFHAGGLAAEGVAYWKGGLALHEGARLLLGVEATPRGLHEGGDQLALDLRGAHGHRNGPARAPEAHEHAGLQTVSKAARAGGDSCVSASRSAGKTLSTRLKRLISKISRTTGW